MGTNGLFGFFYKGKLYLIYNHFDSYPTGLGHALLREIKLRIEAGTLEEWKEMLENIKVIDDTPPTEEDVENLKPYSDFNVNDGSTDNWYCLTRKCQGSYERVLSSGYLFKGNESDIAENEFDFCIEYIYVLDFDKEKFIVHYDRNHINEYSLDHLPTELEGEDDEIPRT